MSDEFNPTVESIMGGNPEFPVPVVDAPAEDAEPEKVSYYQHTMLHSENDMVDQFAAVVRLADIVSNDVLSLKEYEAEGIPVREQGLSQVEFNDIDGALLSWGLQVIGFFRPDVAEEAFQTFLKIQNAAVLRGEPGEAELTAMNEAGKRIARRKAIEGITALGVSFGIPEDEARAKAEESYDQADAMAVSGELQDEPEWGDAEEPRSAYGSDDGPGLG